MNDILSKSDAVLLNHQTQRLRDLVTHVGNCCEDRNLIEKCKFSLPYAELKCLILFKEEKYLTVKGIALKLAVAKSRVTKLIDGLSGKGLVNRIDDPEDGRIKLISVSSKGKALVDEIEKFQQHLCQEILLQLDDQERKDILTHLETLRSAMEIVKNKFM
jgi:DNA-binding MarR family transcriptional regulator